MNLRPKPGSGIWIVDFEDPATGARRRVSTGTRDKAQARLKGREIILGLASAPAASSPANASSRKPAGGVTVGDLFTRCERTVWHPRECRSQATITSNVGILRDLEVDGRRLNDKPAAEVTYSFLERAGEALFARGYAPASVKRKLDMVSKALSMATVWTDDEGKPLLAGKPKMPSITIDNFKDRILSEREEAALFRAVEARRVSEPSRDWRRFGALLRFLLDTGCRLGEALAVLDERIEARRIVSGMDPVEVLFVTFPRYTTKNKKPRVLPLTSAIVGELPYLRAAAVEGRLFPMTAGTAWYMFKNLRADLQREGVDLSDVVLHTMRHTCLSRLAKRMGDLHKVSLWAGHSSIQITSERYAHLCPEDFMGAHAVLEASPG